MTVYVDGEEQSGMTVGELMAELIDEAQPLCDGEWHTLHFDACDDSDGEPA